MDGSPGGQIARSQFEREQLAKHWLLRMIERTPLPEVGELPFSWIASEAPPLISTILSALADPDDESARELTDANRASARLLAGLREGPEAAEQIPRDLATLQGLLIEAIRGELPERRPGDVARAAERLADVFGSIQGAVARTMVETISPAARIDPLTALPGPVELDEWLAVLIAEQRRYGHGFSLALVDVDGLGRINDAYGRSAGDRMLIAVAGVLRRQLRDVDRAFRLEDDEFAILAPHTEAGDLVSIVRRIARLIASSQEEDAPRIAIVAGVADCPADGSSAERLLESATSAGYAAKASGAAVGRSPGARSSPGVLQDP